MPEFSDRKVGAGETALRSLLRRNGRAVKVLARGFGDQCVDYRPTPIEREPLASGRLLIISAFAPVLPASPAPPP
jgi:hypothetical protein